MAWPGSPDQPSPRSAGPSVGRALRLLARRGHSRAPAPLVLRPQEVCRGQDVVDLLLAERPHLQDHLPHTPARPGALLAHEVAVVMADHRVEIGDDADRVLDIAADGLLIGRDPAGALLLEGP